MLTTISNIDTVAVDVAIPMAQYLRYAGTRPSIYENDGLLSDITLSLADGVVYPSKGWYSYTQKDISSSMGTIVLVVKFANPDYTLKPGQFARVTANVGPSLPYVVVPQRAVTQMQDLSSVWVVGARQHGRIPACDARPYCRRPVVHPVGRRAGRMGRYGRYSEVAQRSEGYSDPDQYE